MNINHLIENNKNRYLEELMDLLRIPSVSADPAYQPAMRKCAEWVQKSLLSAGVDSAEVIETDGHPVVYAEKHIGSQYPTVLVYGHYDVQPPDPLELWDSPPFEPVIKSGNIYARGAADDKGQFYMHIKAFELLAEQQALPVNIKFMIEGEEEVGSANLRSFLLQHQSRLAADVILVSDTSMVGLDTPSIETGLRGLAYLEVTATGPNRDLHSGVYGGAVANPINALCAMIASLHDESGRINIPGFYDEVVELSQDERTAMAKRPFDLAAYQSALGVDAVAGESGYSTIERTGIRPTLDVNGIWGGYTGEGAKTVLPSKAHAKLSMRLVPNQSSENIAALFTAHFRAIAPPGIRIDVRPHHGGEPVVTPTDMPAYRAATLAIEQTFGKSPVPTRGGGSIPIIALFEEILGLKTVLMGFGLDSDAIHSPNEHFGIENFLKGIETIAHFHQQFAVLAEHK
ncbi:dipeptidase [Ostreibacterium oceani]|uniref:Dipeptidase n=1 Tax=Ostreibacterium oceani TaxID=2654998 RepID=A0A6N7EVE4_9GAMM|nr:dipeptidase [Ostreibacterium oceani]MPV85933.1 dipeptidase [Ostreibacterium oceani]